MKSNKLFPLSRFSIKTLINHKIKKFMKKSKQSDFKRSQKNNDVLLGLTLIIIMSSFCFYKLYQLI